MSGTEGNRQRPFSKLATRAAVGAAFAMGLTLLLMLAVAALIAAGRLPAEQSKRLIMLCVFIGTLIGALGVAAGQGRGILRAVALCGGMYLMLHILLSVFAGAGHIFGGGFLKTAVCAAAGSALGGALQIHRTGRRPKHRRR